MDLSLSAAFTVGFLSTLHCVGMCGGIIGALTYSLPPEIRQNRRRLVPFILTYSAGRIASYTVAGAIVGALSGTIFEQISPSYGHIILRWLSAFVLIVVGLYVAGWLPKLVAVEKIGRPIWRYLEPIGRRLLPVQSPLRAFLFGAIWGWLPCSLVYMTLIWAGTANSASQSASLMFAFGLGTLPTVVITGTLTSSVLNFARSPWFKQSAGILLIALAVFSIVYGWSHQNHNHNDQFNIAPRETTHEHVQ